MPTFDLRGLKVAKYKNASGTVTYDTPTSMGDAMTVQLNLTSAEGRLYAEGKLAEYMKQVTGGTISAGVKYIPDDAQKLMFGVTEKSRTISTAATKSLLTTAKDTPKYVGLGFYAPDMRDGSNKVTACFVHKVLFGQPAMNLQTKGENIQFQTPTTTGEFLPSDADTQDIMEVAVLDDAANAIAWINACFGASA